jgi:beta-glucanase (GH16 family)
LRRFFFALLLIPLTTLGAGQHSTPQLSAPPKNFTLIWSDEFNGPNGSRPDPSKWTYDLGGNGWGNQELETYTNRPENAQIENGNLVISARKENFEGEDHLPREYTSARLKTQGLFARAYGRFEARIKIPAGQGIWPAFWLLGDNIATAGWPRCGEIDIMENIGKEPGKIHGSLHGPTSAGTATDITAAVSLDSGKDFAAAFHVYAVEWEPAAVRFYVDSTLYTTFTPDSAHESSARDSAASAASDSAKPDSPADRGGAWVFDHPFFIILNVAVGGNWPGPPDATSTYPQAMLVDYVRVYAPKH